MTKMLYSTESQLAITLAGFPFPDLYVQQLAVNALISMYHKKPTFLASLAPARSSNYLRQLLQARGISLNEPPPPTLHVHPATAYYPTVFMRFDHFVHVAPTDTLVFTDGSVINGLELVRVSLYTITPIHSTRSAASLLLRSRMEPLYM